MNSLFRLIPDCMASRSPSRPVCSPTSFWKVSSMDFRSFSPRSSDSIGSHSFLCLIPFLSSVSTNLVICLSLLERVRLVIESRTLTSLIAFSSPQNHHHRCRIISG
jgi:hypothetical protein